MSKPKRPSEIASKTERSIQMALFGWCSCAMVHGFDAAWEFDRSGTLPDRSSSFKVPELKWIHSIPNGAAFGGPNDAERAKRGAMMKMEGLRPGVADIFWPVPRGGHHGLYIEMKTPIGEVREEQALFMEFAKVQGYRVELCRSWIEAAKVIQSYLVGDVS